MANFTISDLPEDVEAEKSLLATICAPGAESAAAECAALLRVDDFMHPLHRAIYAAALQILKQGGEINALTIKHAMGDVLGAVGGYPSIVEALSGDEVSRPLCLVEILVEHRRRRELIKLGHSLATEARKGDKPSQQIASASATALANLSTNSRSGLVSAADAAQAERDRINSGVVTGIYTGFPRLDGKTCGFQPGNLIVLAARPGVGKTVLALNWALNMCQYGRILYYSIEMTREELAKRCACNLGNVKQSTVKSMSMNEFEHAKYDEGLRCFESLDLMIDDNAGTTINDISSQASRQTAMTGQPLAGIMIDHVNIMTPLEGKTKNEQIGAISMATKKLAKSLRCPIILLSQLNRELDKENRAPRLSDLRDSGCVEQDADMVMFIHRKPKPKMDAYAIDNSADLIIAKHRDGELGEIPMEFQGSYARYIEKPEGETNLATARRGF